jgi:phage terminase large subunit-like protein
MSAPTRELEKLIVSRRLAHGANPVTRWMAANVAVAQDPAGNLKPAKDKSTERIDGIVAIIMAIGRAMVAHEEVACTPMAIWV